MALQHAGLDAAKLQHYREEACPGILHCLLCNNIFACCAVNPCVPLLLRTYCIAHALTDAALFHFLAGVLRHASLNGRNAATEARDRAWAVMNQRFEQKYPREQHLDFVELLHDMATELFEKGGSVIFDRLFGLEFSESCASCGSGRDTHSSMYLRLNTENGWKLSTPFESAVLGLGMEFCAQPCTDQLSTPHHMEFQRLPVVLIVEPINQFESNVNVCRVYVSILAWACTHIL